MMTVALTTGECQNTQDHKLDDGQQPQSADCILPWQQKNKTHSEQAFESQCRKQWLHRAKLKMPQGKGLHTSK